jgi:hypothetical protein
VADAGQNRSICGGRGSTTAICCNGACCTGCCARDGACGPCLAFVTSSLHDGDLNGLAGADQRCQLHADLAATPLPGSYKAWLGDATESPATRFRRSAHGYQRVDGVTIADDWADLTDGTLDNPINKTELNAVPQGGQGRVWTNTEANGGQSFSFAECGNWESNGSQTGRFGLHASTDPTWTALGFAQGCGFSAALYCFQQE